MDSLKWSFPVAAKRQRRLLSYQAHQVNLGPSLSLYPSLLRWQIDVALSRFLALLLFLVGRVTLCPAPKTRSPDERSEEHTSELQSLMRISYAVFCLKKTKTNKSTK